MTPGRPWSRSLERIRLIGDSAPDHHSLRTAVLAELGRVLPFNAFVWPLSDPVTATGLSPTARIPCSDELPLLIRLKHLTLAGRWTQLAIRPSPVTTLLRETAGNPSRSLVWDGLMRRYGVSDVLFAVLADKLGCWGWLDLWRTDPGDPFSLEEMEYVGAVVHEVTPGLRRWIARQFAMERSRGSDPVGRETIRARASATGGGPRPNLPQQAVLTLDANMDVVGGTASVEEWLGLLQAGPRPFQRVPAEVLNVAAQLLARETGVDHHSASARVRT